MEHFKLIENVERNELHIVLIGSFNPVIISPAWLSGKSLIRESDANNATVRLIHNEVADYDLSWVTLNITQKRFHLKCTQEPFFEMARDLAVGIFSILKETPIISCGINHNKIIGLKTQERYYEFGNKLSPLANWSDFLNEPKLQRIEIIERNSKQKKEGSVLITIHPSFETDVNLGVAININDHYNFSTEKDGVKFSPSVIMQYWPNSLEIAKNILVKLSNSLQL